MTTQLRVDGTELRERERLEALIAAAVIRALGKPDDLRAVHVRPLWEGYYRVNVLTGDDAATASITNSYFLTTDGAGEILDATPTIVKRY